MLQVLWRIPIHTSWSPQGIPIYGFGMMLFLAFLVCTWLAGRRAEREGVARETMQDLAIWLFIGGLIGARLTFMLVEQPRPRSPGQFLVEFVRIMDGGLVLYGSVVGALVGYVGAWWFTFRPRRIPTLRVADIAAPAVAVGICLGRIGCFLNGCCYGQVACAACAAAYPVHFPLTAPPGEALIQGGYQTAGFTLEPQARGATVGRVVPGSPAEGAGLRPGDVIVGAGGQDVTGPEDLGRYLRQLPEKHRGQTRLDLTVRHAGGGEAAACGFTPRTLGLYPTQLYEAVSMFLAFLLVSAYYPLRRRTGQVMAVLMVCYGVHRYLNEMLRDDPRPQDFEHYTSIVLVACGAALFLYLQVFRSGARPAADAAAEEAAPAGVGGGARGERRSATEGLPSTGR